MTGPWAPLAWVVVAPLLGGTLTVALRGRLLLATVAATWGATALAVGALTAAVWRDGVQELALGGWEPPVGISLVADGLAVGLLATTAVSGLAIGIYASAHLAERSRLFWPLGILLWAALNGLFLSADLFNLYVCLELLTLAAVALVLLAEDRVGLFAATRYLLAAFLGALLFLLGVAFLYGEFGTLALDTLRERMAPGAGAWMGIALVTVGLALKTALFPLHFWLPRAHASAPAPVSAALSALVITGSYYLVLRLWLQVFPPALTPAGAGFLGVLGGCAIVWGSIQAIRQQRLKLMVAYSTVSQVGYLFLIIPLTLGGGLVAEGTPGWVFEAWSGGVYHAVSHAFAKGAMFMAAGCVVRALGHDRIVGVTGIATRLPLATYAFGIGGLTLVGLPPSGGFVAKWLLLTAAFSSGQWWWGVVILLGGILTAGYVFLVLGQELRQKTEGEEAEFRPVPRRMEYSAMALALCGFVLGLRAVEPLALLEVGIPFLNGDGG